MDKLVLLSSHTSGDDQVLETDIMRFMAIIGIVFWIIFSVIKSIPFQAEVPVSSAAVQSSSPKFDVPEYVAPAPEPMKPVAAGEPEPVIIPSLEKTSPAPKLKPKRETETFPNPAETEVPKPETMATKIKTEEKISEQKIKAPAIKGVRLEFQNLDAVMRLVQSNRLAVYGRAAATGFDLIFSGVPTGDTVQFKSARDIPAEMWEIKDGQARQYFVDLMTQTFPSVRTFPGKKVQVAFLDKALEDHVMSEMERLQQSNRSGILSVTEDGELMFRAQE